MNKVTLKEEIAEILGYYLIVAKETVDGRPDPKATNEATQSILSAVKKRLVKLLDGNKTDIEATNEHQLSKGATEEEISQRQADYLDMNDQIDDLIEQMNGELK